MIQLHIGKQCFKHDVTSSFSDRSHPDVHPTVLHISDVIGHVGWIVLTLSSNMRSSTFIFLSFVLHANDLISRSSFFRCAPCVQFMICVMHVFQDSFVAFIQGFQSPCFISSDATLHCVPSRNNYDATCFHFSLGSRHFSFLSCIRTLRTNVPCTIAEVVPFHVTVPTLTFAHAAAARVSCTSVHCFHSDVSDSLLFVIFRFHRVRSSLPFPMSCGLIMSGFLGFKIRAIMICRG